jgi:RimJ/RimL family protein N-acetyltransferase
MRFERALYAADPYDFYGRPRPTLPQTVCDDGPMRELMTARLRLRSWSFDDADFLFDMYSRWEVQRFIGPEPTVMVDRGEAVASIERRRSLDHPIHGIWAIETLADRELVGNLLLKPIPASGGQSLPRLTISRSVGTSTPTSGGTGMRPRLALLSSPTPSRRAYPESLP